MNSQGFFGRFFQGQIRNAVYVFAFAFWMNIRWPKYPFWPMNDSRIWCESDLLLGVNLMEKNLHMRIHGKSAAWMISMRLFWSFLKQSMYGIFTYIYHKNEPNVGKYTIHGSYGLWVLLPCRKRSHIQTVKRKSSTQKCLLWRGYVIVPEGGYPP